MYLANISPLVLLSLALILIILIIWENIWKGIGMWKSAKNNQLHWFIAIFVFNTIGILPIIYLLYFQKKNLKSK